MAAVETEKGWKVECAYCFSSDTEMANPRRLPCGHVNCLKGIQDDFEANNKILKCPKCKKAFDKTPCELPRYCPGEDPTAGLLCEFCVDDQQAAKVFCLTCAKKICKTHEKEHESLYPKHTNVISMADYVPDSRRLAPQFCLKHEDQQLIMICQPCSTKFCGTCEDTDDVCKNITSGGRPHMLTNVKRLAENFREDLKDVKSMAMVKETTYKDFAKECAQILCDYDTETNQMISDIDGAMQEQLDALRKEYKTLKDRLGYQRNETRKAMTQFVDTQVDTKEKEMSNQIQLIDLAVQDMHEIEVIEYHPKMKEKVQQLVAKPMAYMNFQRLTKFERTGKRRTIELDLSRTETFTIGDANQATEQPHEPYADYLQPGELERGTLIDGIDGIDEYTEHAALDSEISGSFVVMPMKMYSPFISPSVDYNEVDDDQPQKTAPLLRCPECNTARNRRRTGILMNHCANCDYRYQG